MVVGLPAQVVGKVTGAQLRLQLLVSSSVWLPCLMQLFLRSTLACVSCNALQQAQRQP